MKRHRTTWLVSTGVFLSLAFAFIACDDDVKPTEPDPPPEPKDYMFYFNDGGYHDRYYRYFSESERADSLTIPHDSRKGFAAAADGSRLYLPDGNKTVVVDTDSFEDITVIDFECSHGVSVSPDNQYVAIIGDDVRILSASDYTLVFHDTDAVWHGIFSADSKQFYCVGGWSGDGSVLPYVYSVNLADSSFPVQRHTFSDGGAWRIVPAVDGSRWFLYLKYDTFGYVFEVYDVAKDSIIFRDLLTPGAGDIEVTPDGKYAFYSNPGTTLVGPPPPSDFTVFDIEANAIHKIVSTEDSAGGTSTFMPIGNFAITPDGRKLLAVRGPTGGDFLVFDVNAMEIDKRFNVGNQAWLWNVTIQNGAGFL